MRLDIHNADIPVLCRACESRHRGICGALDAPGLLRLGRTASRHEYAPGTTLVAAGEEVSRYSNILSGIVKLSRLLPDGRQQVVGLQFAPDFVGRPFAAESDVLVEAASAVRLCSFPRSAVEQMIAESPALENRLHRQALRQLDEARDWMVTLGRKTATEKVASFILMLCRNVSPEEPYSKAFEMPLARADIADFLGLTTETVSRQLTRLRQAGLIGIERARNMTIKDVVGLEKAAGS